MAGTLVTDTIKSSLSTPPVFQNTSGVEIGQLTRSWVNFNGGSAAVRTSFNISSVSRAGVGAYSATMTTAMADANYVVGMSAGLGDGTNNTDFALINFPRSSGTTPVTTTVINVHTTYRSSGATIWLDAAIVHLTVYR